MTIAAYRNKHTNGPAPGRIRSKAVFVIRMIHMSSTKGARGKPVSPYTCTLPQLTQA